MSLAKKELELLNIDSLKDVLLSQEELEYHAKELARQHSTYEEPLAIRPLVKRLDENFETIVKVYKRMSKDSKEKKPLSPASEWLLDNFYKVEEQVKDVRLSLLKDRFMKLYTIRRGLYKGYPRVYAIILDYISHTDGNIEEDSLIKFIKSYQTQRVLSIAEIWSISLMARIALIKNISLICERIYTNQGYWQIAEELAEKEPNEIIKYLKENLEYSENINSSFVEHLLRQLRRAETETGDVVSYLSKKLSEINTSIKEIIEYEHHDQATRKISIGNSIISLNTVSTLDWNDIFESINVVEKTLSKDPMNIYKFMDFESRDYYRIQVEKISILTKRSETKVAQMALDLANKYYQQGERDKKAHVGYYLLDKGKEELLVSLDRKNLYKPTDKSLGYYLTPILLISILFPLATGFLTGIITNSILLGATLTFLLVIPFSDVAVHLVNYIMLKIHPPKMLSRMEMKMGIPKDSSTFVVVPTLLPNESRVQELLDQLEVHYQGNKEENLYFALVGDFKDSKQEKEKSDNRLIEIALKGVKDLNKRYPSASGENRFYFFLRKRQFSEKQKRWMGWERKRGALQELNNLLLGDKKTSYNILSSSPPQNIKYILTLDADTNLPIETAKKMVGIISHPLNRPVFDEKKGIVTEGHGLIQPRISVDLESANKTLFTKTYAGQGGIDPYTTASSDIYQDLFSEGIFTGKGIYDLRTFSRALHNSIPENAILSHDLLEGSYLRAGLVTDVELVDGYPAKFSSYIMRLHRWVRGDWQLTPWLFSKVNTRNNKKEKNPLSALSKWKIADNLRRSLVPVFVFALISLSMIFVENHVWIPILLGLLTLFFPAILNTFEYFKVGQNQVGYVKNNVRKFYGVTALWYQVLLNFVFLPYQSYMLMDAICRTLYRVCFSKRKMLEWVTAADAEKNLQNDLSSYIKRMKSGIFLTMIVLGTTLIITSANTFWALPISVIWLLAPFAAYKTSQEIKRNKYKLTDHDTENLRRIARKTWGYYDDFGNAFNNYLPPDNYQVYPPRGIAQRTSPTNIGCMFMGILAAKDFGYITHGDTLIRVNNTLNTVDRLETWKGHLYNWYETSTLEVLRPSYVSTVDNGNFISYLITLKEGLKDLSNDKIFTYNKILGLRDTAVLANAEHDIKLLFNLKQSDINQREYKEIIQSLLGAEEEGLWQQKYNESLDEFKEEITEFIPDTLFEDYSEYKKINESLLQLNQSVSLSNLKEICKDIITQIVKIEKNKQDEKLINLKESVQRTIVKIYAMEQQRDSLVQRLDRIIENTDFSHLYDKKRNLFSIGYNVEEERLTNSYYDLLASEARTTSYIAIAKGEIPKKHWFKLGRGLTVVEGFRSLVSWTGTMFEYFMPNLLMKNYTHTLMEESYKGVVMAQKKYGAKRKIPWGVSESGYYTFDMLLNYQYRAFGIPDLGLKRGLSNDMVVSPYSTILGISIDPKGCLDNLTLLIEQGLEGNYGLYEAVDYTPARVLVHGSDKKIVKSFMAHHQGMILMALDNFLNNNILQKRFHQNPLIRAGELLLQEKIPLRAIVTKEFKEVEDTVPTYTEKPQELVRKYEGIEPVLPKCHILSNGRYSVMLTERGGGYSRCNDIQITRWREDSILGKYGTYIIIKKANSDKVWSNTYEPLMDEGDSYKVKFYQDKAEYQRYDENITTKTEVSISSEDNVEIRKVTLSNHETTEVTLEITSFMETVLGNHAADLAHPTFSNLFVRTEYLPEYETLLASRRPREEDKDPNWGFHSVSINGQSIGVTQYETMRGNFIGRGNTLKNADAVYKPLTNSAGIVLDPILSLRKTVRIPAGQSIIIHFVTGVGEDRQEAIELSKKYRDEQTVERGFELAYTRSQVEMSYLDIKPKELKVYQDMISSLIYQSPTKEKYRDIISSNKKNQSALWSYGISGDLPIVLLSIKKTEDIDVFQNLLKAHEYWSAKGLKVDLVVLNEDENSYLQPLQRMLNDIIATSHGKHILDVPGGVFIKNGGQIPQEDKTLLYTVAKIIIHADGGPISKQIESPIIEQDNLPMEFKQKDVSYQSYDEPLNTEFYNGYGGFSHDGLEYIIRLKEGKKTPAPWINVISNEKFGFQVSESGAGFTWAENSRENKLTPWSNDPVSDPPEEVIYIRDDETGKLFTPTALPIRENNSYTVKHGMGYSIFSHDSYGIHQELTMFVPRNDSVKVNLLKLKNNSKETRKLTLTYYMRPVMGVNEQLTKNYISTSFEEGADAMVVRNPYSIDFPNRVTYVTTSERVLSYTGSRREFIGEKEMDSPQALKYRSLSNKVGGGLDPCVALQMSVELKPLSEKEISFVMGHVKEDEGHLGDILPKYKSLANCNTELKQVKRFWKEVLAKIQVDTPDKSMDYMLNGWLLYQTLACRVWARSAFYQSGGAYGYRDQLQDTMNVVYNLPEATRKQILLHCEHQFVEGDVQHWWHPGAGDKGIRTRFSDDLLWLPLVTADYVKNTGDFDLLNEETHFLEDEPLGKEDERYGIPRISTEKATVYEHCIRAIERGLRFGENGIPLMGSGDWNDGMSTVGNKGKGESIWLGWFIHKILKDFLPILKHMGDEERGIRYIKVAEEIAENIEKNAWDGEWYLRAFYDDGSPLGSSKNTECIIDSLGQTWSIISGGGKNKERIDKAMESVEKYLVKRDQGLIQLFTPPFDNSDQKPGYIKGYVPGVRENGGQYTHAAIWVINAYAMYGDGDKAWELYNMVNPINHSRTPIESNTYKVEPYVLAADVYAVSPHVGRGGWTWYTGAAGWMYRVGIEHILGLKTYGDKLMFNPCIPKEWNKYHISYVHGNTPYQITIRNPKGINKGVDEIYVDGEKVDKEINMVDDGVEHVVEVIMG